MNFWKDLKHITNGLSFLNQTRPSVKNKLSIKQRAAQFGYERGLAQAAMRPKGYFPGADSGQLRGDWTNQLSSAVSVTHRDFKQLCARSELAYRTDATFKRAINVLATFIIGQGMKPFPDVKLLKSGENIEMNKILERDWPRFVEEGFRNGPSRINMYQAQYQALVTMAVYGSVLTNRVRSKTGSYLPYAYQLIKPTRLDFTKDTYFGGNWDQIKGGDIVHGMEINEYGEPQNYHLEYIDKPFSAEQMFLAFIPTEAEQYLALPWGTAVLPEVWDVQQLFADKLAQSRIGAKLGFYMPRKSQDDFSALIETTESGQEYMPLDFQGFAFFDEKPQPITMSDAIEQTFDPLVRMTIAKIASGFGFSYQLLASDLKGMNFAASRANIISDNKTFRTLFSFFNTNWNKPIWDSFVEWEVLSGKIPGLDYARFLRDKHYYTQCYWLPLDGEDWVDPLKDAQSLELLYKMGQITYQELCSRAGKDYQTILKQRKRERELFAEYDPALLTNSGNPKLQTPTVDNTDPTESGDLVGVGEGDTNE